MYQTPWSLNDGRLVFYNKNSEIFILNLNNKSIMEVPCKGINVMWLGGLNTISYLNEDSIQSYNLSNEMINYVYLLNDSSSSYSEILDYYWFASQKKFYIKERSTNKLFDKIWSNTDYIIQYNCKAPSIEKPYNRVHTHII